MFQIGPSPLAQLKQKADLHQIQVSMLTSNETESSGKINEVNGNVQIDANGVPILKGYRPPFKKGYDSRRAVQIKGPRPKTPLGTARNILAAVRRSFKQHCEASEFATDIAIAVWHAKLARLFLDMELDLTGKGFRYNSGKNRDLRKSAAISPIQPIQPISPIKTPSSLPPDASLSPVPCPDMVRPIATRPESIQTTKNQSESVDDCPF